jgi:4-aminobutyrate aminotransferase-like enzyme
MAAVVCTTKIAESFVTGMEYFNTFGGNPVSCATGMAVLDVIAEENLQQNALRVGDRMMYGFEELKERHPLIGDVRGAGLFIGVELVSNHETLAPATDEAALIIEKMKDHGILLSTDGPFDNVIKIKPPIVFNENNADRVVDTLDAVLTSMHT